MKINEIYTPSEFKRTDEYKHFTAEQYFTATENKKTSEVYNKSGETLSDMKTNEAKPKNSDKGATENARRQITDFTAKLGTSVATTAAAAVVSVVALSGVFIGDPTISDFSLEVASNSVYYEFVIEDMSEEFDYYVKVENPKQEFEYKIEDKNVANTVTDLYDDSAYTLSVVGESKDGLTDKTYYQTDFVTLRATRLEMQLGPPTLSGINTYSVPYEIDKTNADEIEYKSLALNIVYEDGTTETVEAPLVATKGEITVSDISIMHTSMTCSAELTYSRVGEDLIMTATSQSVERDLSEEFALLETRVGLYEYDAYFGQARMRFAWRGHEDAYVYINNGTDETTAYYNPEAYIDVDVNGTAPTTITYELRYDGGVNSGASGPIYMEGGAITVNCADMPTGSMRHANPGDLSRSYNPDGTINYYVETQLSCDDPEAYWEINLSNSGETFTFTGRDAVAAMEDLPFVSTGYAIILSVVKQVDGINYVLDTISPSGDSEEYRIGNACLAEYSENGDGTYTVTVKFYRYSYSYDFDNLTLMIDGVATKITQDGLKLDESGYMYVYTYDCDTLPTLSVDMRVSFAGTTLTDPNYEVKGDKFKRVVVDLEYRN